MTLLTGLDTAYIKAQQSLGMPDTCTLRTVTLTSDGSGGWTEGTSDQASVPCRLMYQTGNEGIRANMMVSERSYILTIPSTYTLTPATRVIKGGVTYEVDSVNQSQSWQTATRAMLKRVEA